LPPELETFLAAPGPVLFVTFGSFPDVDGRTERMVAAARTSQWRAIIQVLPQAPAPSSAADLYVLRTRVNFASLLARVTAVVHHGSSGTTHEVVRAGCPSLVVPQVAEQLFLGVQLALRQLAPPPLQLGERDPGLLAARFGELRNPRHATAVARVAPLVAAENGVARAASLLETTLATLRA
jgi:sterol 3beta-glucosyltransferase